MKIVNLADLPKQVGGVDPGPEILPKNRRNPSDFRNDLHTYARQLTIPIVSGTSKDLQPAQPLPKLDETFSRLER